jgi:hypothetical protein
MTSLNSRFREIEVTTEAPVEVPAGREWPANWLSPQLSSALVRFVETRFEPNRTNGAIRRIFGETLQISARPMPLRSIFVTLARTGAGPESGIRRGA